MIQYLYLICYFIGLCSDKKMGKTLSVLIERLDDNKIKDSLNYENKKRKNLEEDDEMHHSKRSCKNDKKTFSTTKKTPNGSRRVLEFSNVDNTPDKKTGRAKQKLFKSNVDDKENFSSEHENTPNKKSTPKPNARQSVRGLNQREIGDFLFSDDCNTTIDNEDDDPNYDGDDFVKETKRNSNKRATRSLKKTKNKEREFSDEDEKKESKSNHRKSSTRTPKSSRKINRYREDSDEDYDLVKSPIFKSEKTPKKPDKEKPKSKSTSKKNYKCTLCEEKFSYKKHLDEHNFLEHSDEIIIKSKTPNRYSYFFYFQL